MNAKTEYAEATLYHGDPEKETVCDGYIDPETGETMFS